MPRQKTPRTASAVVQSHAWNLLAKLGDCITVGFSYGLVAQPSSMYITHTLNAHQELPCNAKIASPIAKITTSIAKITTRIYCINE
jgi:hypothetical protein